MAARLADKVAIVTVSAHAGLGVGTGKATSVLFAQEGARVVLVDKFEERALETQARIKEGAWPVSRCGRSG